MLARFDHVVLGVADLRSAAAAFREAGFDVFDRGGQSGPMENRLIRFPDRSFIELIAFHEPDRHRFWGPVSKGDGWVDYALSVEGMEAMRRALEGAGLPVAGIRRVAQPAANGRNWEMDLLLAGLGVGSPALPFLTQDLTPPDWRLPPLEPGRRQPGNAAGIAGATILVPSLAAMLSDLAALCGAPSSLAKDAQGNAASARFDFNGRWLEFAVPEPGGEAAAHLEKRGPGLYAVTLKSSRARPGRLDVGDRFGAVLLL